MGTVEKVSQSTMNYLEKFRIFAVYIGEKKNIKKKAHLFKDTELNKKQEEEIDSFFISNYGQKISHKWHKLYQSYTGIYNKDYFPEILFSTKLEPKLNDYYLAKLFGDKNLLELFFNQSEHVTVPKTFVSCVNGTYRNHNHAIVSKSEAIQSIGNLGKAVIKKSLDTSSGRDVMLCMLSEGIDLKTNLTVKEIVDKMGNDFIVQEKILQWKDVADLYAKSLNTFRIVTYIVEDQVFVSPISLRMGRNNAEVDNVHFGGITIGVSKDGQLKEKAYSEYQEIFDHHPDTGVNFSEHKISGMHKLIEGAKELHTLIPHLKMVSWDLCLDSQGNVVLIEMNTIGQSVWFPQMVNGEPMFGEHTPYMLKLIAQG